MATLKAQNPAPPAYPQEAKSLGDHLRKRRLDLKLLQKELAHRLGVSKNSICNWENKHRSPSLYSIPKIIQFLGYVPYNSQAKTVGEKIASSRRFLGLSQEELAHLLGIDPSTLGRWESGKRRPSKKLLKELTTFLTSVLPDGEGPAG